MSNFLRVKVARLARTLMLMLPFGAAIPDGVSAQPSDLAAFPPTGRMILVNGRHVHLYCTGAGAPTVILEAGLGQASLNWALVQRTVAKTTRVCSYDRPGYGWSDAAADVPMDAANTSQQLYALLRLAGERPPYLPVGHSLGGAYARVFATEHRKDVAGLVLVDSTHPSHMATASEVGLPPIDAGSSWAFVASSDILWKVVVGLGVAHFTYDTDVSDFPADMMPVMKVFMTGPQRGRMFLKERASVSDTLTQVGALDSLGNLPVMVISSDRWIDANPEIAAKRAEWNKRQQRNHLAISANSHFLVIPRADHLSLLSNKDHAGAVAKAIVQMVAGLRHY